MERSPPVAPTSPSTGRPKPTWAKRCLQSSSASQQFEKSDAVQEEALTACTLIPRPSFPDSEKALAVLTDTAILFPTPPTHPSMGYPKRSSERRSAAKTALKIPSESLHTSFLAIAGGTSPEASMCPIRCEASDNYGLSSSNANNTPMSSNSAPGGGGGGAWHRASSHQKRSFLQRIDEHEELFQFALPTGHRNWIGEPNFNGSEETSATQTDALWIDSGAVSSEPLLPSINGCWKMCSTVDANGIVKTHVATWLSGLCISNMKVRDGEGRYVSLKVRNGCTYLEGGRLYLDSRGLLHRYGKSGAHTWFRRCKLGCQTH